MIGINDGAITGDNLGNIPAADMKLAYNLVNWISAVPTPGSNQRRTGSTQETIGSILSPKWSPIPITPQNPIEPATIATGNPGSGATIYKGVAFWVDGNNWFHAYDVNPQQSLNGTNLPDDGIPDLLYGSSYDQVYNDGGQTLPGAGAAWASTPTIIAQNVGGTVNEVAVVTTTDGSTYFYNALPRTGGVLASSASMAIMNPLTRDGDMTGGDFPAWLPTLFSVSPQAQASAANLVDRRGECIHAGCPHYRVCFIEKAVRGSRRADIVIANHALVLTQAALDGARAARGQAGDTETSRLRRIVFDEGHHLFDAADNAFAAALSGAESAEMRRWIRGPEGRGRRGRGLETRLLEVLGEREDSRAALLAAVRAAAVLPGEGWSGRIAPGAGDVSPSGPVEAFLVAMLEQLRARATPSDVGMECAARPALDLVRHTARAAAEALAALETPLLALARQLETVLDDEADTLEANERARIEGALRGLDRRARMQLPAWRSMLVAIDENADDDPDFVDWFDATFLYGRVVDAACRRHWVDPTEPLTAAVIAPAHGVLVTSATLADSTLIDPFALAEMRTGAARLQERPKTLRLASPFDYGQNALALVVTDVGRDDPRQVAAAMRELFLAAGGGGLGVFTAIRRLRAVHEKIAGPMADRGLSLLAQHVDPLDVSALVDIFRAEIDTCLLGTDAVRDGIDVPGRSLRLLIFDRIPWPRPDILHKARRTRFGGKGYDDSLARARIAQAFGRLIRRADDRGVFVMLDAAAPTRLFSGLPEGARLERVSLVEAIEATASHVGT